MMVPRQNDYPKINALRYKKYKEGLPSVQCILPLERQTQKYLNDRFVAEPILVHITFKSGTTTTQLWEWNLSEFSYGKTSKKWYKERLESYGLTPEDVNETINGLHKVELTEEELND